MIARMIEVLYSKVVTRKNSPLRSVFRPVLCLCFTGVFTWTVLAQGPPLVDAAHTIPIRFVDSATGYAIQPEVSVSSHNANGRERRVAASQVDAGGFAALRLERGRHTITASAPNYRPMSGELEVDGSEAYRIVFVLDPVVEPRELRADYIASLHRPDATVFVGFVIDEDSGKPVSEARVSSQPGGVETRTDERGYFQLHVPVPTEANASPANLLFEKPGYRAEERQHLQLWPGGDWIYRISLSRGGGRTVVDERGLRRHEAANVALRQEEDALALSRDGQASDEPIIANGPVPASSSNLVVRVPRTIRVLRQDGVTVDYVTMETYTKRVLPREWISSWANFNGGINSLKAGAVAIRTFGAGYVSRPLASTHDICATTTCQVYDHAINNANANLAVDQTIHYVMVPPGAQRITFKLTEYSAENNALNPDGPIAPCGDGYTGNTVSTCIADPVCAGEMRFGHGRGMCQWGSARWATGFRFANRSTADQSPNGQPQRDWIWIAEHYYPSLQLVQAAPLVVNDFVKVLGTNSLTVRECAGGGISSGVNCPQITTKPSGATGVIVGGPVHVTTDGFGYTWWRVQWHDSGPTIGWSPENWLERTPEPPNVPPVLAPIPNMAVDEGTLLTFTNTAAASENTDIFITDFEGFGNNTDNGTVMFRQPSFSGSTSGMLDASPNSTSVVGSFPAGNDSARVLRANWSWKADASNPWLRLTTSGTANLPNPVIHVERKVIFDIHSNRDVKVAVGIRETGNPEGTPIGADGGSSGVIEWAGVTGSVGGQPQCVRTVAAGSWTTLIFDLPNEPIRSFFQGDGVLSTPTDLAVLEHVAFVPAAGNGAYDVHLDNFIVSTPKALTYSLTNAPPGAAINPATGVFTWTPTEAQGPGVYNITVRVTDNSIPPQSDSKTFQVTVNEVNHPPELSPIIDYTVHAGSTITFTNFATDTDIPANALSYSLDSGAPDDASVHPDSAVFSWTTTDADAGSTNAITVRVTDNGVPPLSDAQTFTAVVLDKPNIQSASLEDGNLALTWTAIEGTTYRVQYKDDLNEPAWTTLGDDVVASGPTASISDPVGSAQRFYRIIVVD
jgi:hypothetical protein